MSPSALPPFLRHLLDRLPGARLIETHISWVILAGDDAYKLKKPLNLGFLDFSTLAKRRFCCEEEIRLNRRLAPDIYLDVVPVTGTEADPCFGDDGPILEWAVHMRAFPADATLDREAEVTPAQIDAIADAVAAFHLAHGPVAGFGAPEQVQAPCFENLAVLAGLPVPEELRPPLARLEAWTRAAGTRLEPRFSQRQEAGFVRECHGDLHLGNIAWVHNAPLIFDGIEFNPALRCVDVLSEMAFLVMDLIHRGAPRLAWRALNRYLEHTGDYAGLDLLPYYLVYRALVRAKVEAIRAHQTDEPLPQGGRVARDSGSGEGGACKAPYRAPPSPQPLPPWGRGDYNACRAYLDLAERLALPGAPQLILMLGVSGSGKTWLSQQVLESLGAIRLRADVERKRLFGLKPLDSSRHIPGGIYTPEVGARTLERLLTQARPLLAAGWPVIMDATFLAASWREAAIALAQELGVPWRILRMPADPATLHDRLAQRDNDASEADAAVMEAQLNCPIRLTPEEAARTLDGGLPFPDLLQALSTAP